MPENAMAYKTILVHVPDTRRAGNLVSSAIILARRFEAHLIGLSVLPPAIVEPALTPGGGTVVIETHREAFAQEIERMKAAFLAATREAALSAEWVSGDADPWPVWTRVADFGRATDLIVAAAPEPGARSSSMTDAPVDLVLKCGRPVVLIPNAGTPATIGSRVLVAWNNRREAARAAFDALPLLKVAEAATVLSIGPEDVERRADDVPAADLCTALARHRVKCEAAEARVSEQAVGAALLAAAREMRADLLVMGCYGHSRLRELVLGGATRHVLANAAIPVLMAH
jgi:nucleotide-binding universal stress UspA family protein